MKQTVTLIHNKNAGYPSKETLFRPSIAYPEYPFDEIASRSNAIYAMVREGFRLSGYDQEHYGSDRWNPLSRFIKLHDCVLIKPNMVRNFNVEGRDVTCLYTNPSLVAAVIDYVVLALRDAEGKQTGRIIIGDAPLQTCNFSALVQQSGYSDLLAYYREKGIDIEMIDFRNTVSMRKNGLLYQTESEQEHGCIVQLGEKSAFAELTKAQMDKLRITSYGPSQLKSHHSVGHHEYKIANAVLEADVVINMPKPKTHRKAGITAALKNMVGISADKTYLPHHMMLSKEEGGDAYLYADNGKRIRDELLDAMNEAALHQQLEIQKLLKLAIDDYEKDRKKNILDPYNEGSWYGNQTIWRTIADLNKILFYADKSGEIQQERQRRYLIVADMILSGDHEGPLEALPVSAGVIAMGENPVLFDRVLASLMGFDYSRIPSLTNIPAGDSEDVMVVSNDDRWDKCSYIPQKDAIFFVPADGWSVALGNKENDALLAKIREKNLDKIYIWGCSARGLGLANYFYHNGFTNIIFLDQDPAKWSADVFCSMPCIAPDKREHTVSIITVPQKYWKEISKVRTPSEVFWYLE